MTRKIKGMVIGTINHNHIDGVRIDLWMDAQGYVWADRDNPYKIEDVDRADNYEHAVQLVALAYCGECWDFQPT